MACKKLLPKAKDTRSPNINCVEARYLPGQWKDGERKPYGIGRVFAEHGCGGQSLPRSVRHTIFGKLYHDLDFENCHPRILEKLCKDNGIPHSCLFYYINNRKELLQELVDLPGFPSREEAKKLVLKIVNSKGKVQDDHPQWLKDFSGEIEEVRERFYEIYPDFCQFADTTKGNTLGSVMNILLCTY